MKFWFFFFLFVVVEMEINTQESILETRFMDSVFTNSQMVTTMKEHGTKVVSKAMARMDSGPVIPSAVNGMMVISLTGFLQKSTRFIERFRYIYNTKRLKL